MLKLSEIFLSIQGESTWAGLPCIFVRLAGCNLRCSYCDSPYSYQPGMELSLDQLLEQIDRFAPVKLVEITGGEPLLQDEVYPLFQRLLASGYTLLLETNGSILMDKVPAQVHKIMDIKCPGSGMEDSFDPVNCQYLIPECDEIKFVLSDREDYDWAKKQIETYRLQTHTILFSCVFDRLHPAQLAQWITDDRLPVRMQLQMHKYIWDPAARGV